jgi:hypothetical protein
MWPGCECKVQGIAGHQDLLQDPLQVFQLMHFSSFSNFTIWCLANILVPNLTHLGSRTAEVCTDPSHHETGGVGGVGGGGLAPLFLHVLDIDAYPFPRRETRKIHAPTLWCAVYHVYSCMAVYTAFNRLMPLPSTNLHAGKLSFWRWGEVGNTALSANFIQRLNPPFQFFPLFHVGCLLSSPPIQFTTNHWKAQNYEPRSKGRYTKKSCRK